MNKHSGIEIAEIIGNHSAAACIVFLTAFSNYAIEACGMNIFRYVLIVDELAKDTTVAKAYQAWGEWQTQILMTYSPKAPPLPPLSGQKQLKSIKNMVIAIFV